MKYTNSSQGDKKIEQDMNAICREILDRVRDAETIILTGGFSRAEGAVKKEKGKIFPYNDYDIQVISSSKYNKEEIDRISVEISKKLGYKGISNFYPFKKEKQSMKDNFYIDLKIDSAKSLNKMLPRIRTYELRNSSMLLYGKDLRSSIPNYSLKEIPLSEGAKLLLDRMSQMIEYYSTEKKHDKEFLIYIIQQAYAACCTSLLLLNRKYEIGYKRAMEILKSCYKEDFPELYEKVPNLDKKIEKFIEWKLKPKKVSDKNVKKEWFIAKRNILEVSKYFFSRFLNKRLENAEELSNAISDMRKQFYSPYLKEIIKKKIGIRIKLNWLLLPLIFRILTKKYTKRLKEMNINFKPKLKRVSPDLVIFSSMIPLIDAINENSIDEIKLNGAREILRRVYPAKGNNWEELSLDYANAYIAFFLQKIQ